VYQQQQQQQQQQQEEQQQYAENPFLDPPFSRIKTSTLGFNTPGNCEPIPTTFK
jgi:hypothetical protein